MADFLPGDKYSPKNTPRNVQNGIGPHDDVRISHVDGQYISILVIHKGGGSQTRLAVPRALFGGNFAQDKTAPLNKAYASNSRAKTVYK